ncbi:MFS transporter [Gemmiger sp.]
MHTTYRKLLFCRGIAQIASAALRFALLLYLLRQTSAALYGIITAAALVPMLMGVLIGGMLADRTRKQSLLAAADTAAAIGLFIAALFADTVPAAPFAALTLCILYAVEGLCQPAAQACLPLLLCGPALAKGNAAYQLVGTGTEMLGTLLGGLLFSALGPRTLLLLGAFLFIVSACQEKALPIPAIQTPHAKAPKSPLLIPHLFGLAAVLALLNLAVVPVFTVGVPVLIVQHLNLSDTALALTQSAMSAGGLLGSALAGVFAKHLPLRRGTVPLICITAACVLLGAAVLPGMPAGPGYAVITASALLMMTAAALFQVMLNTAILARVPAAQVGGAMGTVTAAACITQPVGQAAFGLAFDVCAAFPATVPFAASAAAALLTLASGPVFRHFTKQ